MRKGLLAVAALAALLISYKSGRHSGFDDGWEGGRCYDWQTMNKMPEYNGFDRSKISDTERESYEQSCDIVAKWSNESFLTKMFE